MVVPMFLAMVVFFSMIVPMSVSMFKMDILIDTQIYKQIDRCMDRWADVRDNNKVKETTR